jgi:hypothetical protein
MLKTGIISNSYSKNYLSTIKALKYFQLIGTYDPKFQFQYPNNINHDFVYSSFENLLSNTDILIFTSPEKIYLPLIETAIKRSKHVFLHSVHNLSLDEQADILKLHEESKQTIQIFNPLIFNNIFNKYVLSQKNPLLLEYFITDNSEVSLLQKTRSAISAVLPVFKSNIRKITVNTISSLSEIPDIYKIRLDFDNSNIADFTITNVGSKKHIIKLYNYNVFYEIDLLNNFITGTKIKQKNEIADLLSEKNNLNKHLTDFYYNVINHNTPVNCIDNEITVQIVIKKIKEKLRYSINLC